MTESNLVDLFDFHDQISANQMFTTMKVLLLQKPLFPCFCQHCFKREALSNKESGSGEVSDRHRSLLNQKINKVMKPYFPGVVHFCSNLYRNPSRVETSESGQKGSKRLMECIALATL